MGLNFGQQLFPPRGEALVNFDWTDIADGTGYVIYYGMRGDDGEYMTTPSNLIFSEEIVSKIQDQEITTSAVKYFDLDFDITFNVPKNIKGKIIANVPRNLTGKSKSLSCHSTLIVSPSMTLTTSAVKSSNICLCGEFQ